MNKVTRETILAKIEELNSYIKQNAEFIKRNQDSVDKYKKENSWLEEQIKSLMADLK